MPQEQRPTEKFRTSVGGQALMEGIMMRGPEKICCAVRRPDGTIDLSYSDVTTHWYNKVPLVRGVCNMVENLMNGYKYLMHSADIAMTEEEKEEEKQNESKLDRWLDEHAGPKVQSALMTLSACAGVVLAIFLFTFLPTFLTGLVAKMIPMGRWPRVILEAVLKLAIFLGYMFLCTRMKEIHRMFQYHGAEHKTIACYEAGEELTVANIRRHTRFHPRCGTSFLILVILVSIVLYAVLPWSGTMLRVLYKLAMLPLLVGICYEILKWAGRSNSLLARAVSVPGLWLQHLTTFEPEDDMIEVAIAAVIAVFFDKVISDGAQQFLVFLGAPHGQGNVVGESSGCSLLQNVTIVSCGAVGGGGFAGSCSAGGLCSGRGSCGAAACCQGQCHQGSCCKCELLFHNHSPSSAISQAFQGCASSLRNFVSQLKNTRFYFQCQRS